MPAAEVKANIVTILNKTEAIVKASSDQTVKNSMRIITDRLKSFLDAPKPASSLQKEENLTEATAEELPNVTEPSAKDSCAIALSTSVETKKTQKPVESDEDSEVSRLIKETSENSQPEAAEVPQEIDYPAIIKTTKKLLTESSDQCPEHPPGKKIKFQSYSSPLEFLRLPKNKYGS